MNRDPHLDGAWLQLILGEWRHIRASSPDLAQLRPPNIELSASLPHTLGRWDASRRLITLSTQLLEGRHWQILLDTLRHEIAHQVVSELLGRGNEPPHGPTFRAACRLVGADPAATTDALNGGERPADKVRDRILKLLALGRSPNHHEAELALARAHELALRYNIDLRDAAERSEYERRLVGPPMSRIPSYYWSVTAIVADFYFVQYISRSVVDPRRGSKLKVVELYGTPTNLDLAEYVFHFLLNQGLAEWRAYKEVHRAKGITAKLSFLKGVYAGFHERLCAERDRLATCRALVWVGDPGLERFFHDANPRIRRRKVTGRRDDAAHAAGRVVGGKLKIAPGVGSASGGPVGYLE